MFAVVLCGLLLCFLNSVEVVEGSVSVTASIISNPGGPLRSCVDGTIPASQFPSSIAPVEIWRIVVSNDAARDQ
jgi:hypothetical protein